MSNLNAPAGFVPCNAFGSADYNPNVMQVAFAATDGTAAFKGSLVKLTGAVDTDGITPIVTLCSPSDTKIAGAITGFFMQVGGNFTQYYRTASTHQIAYIPRNPQQLYMVQENSVPSNIDVTTKIGDNCNFTAEGGSTVTGQSTMQLDSNTAANTSSLPIRLVSPVYQVGNDPTTASANGNWIVKINQNDIDNTTGT